MEETPSSWNASTPISMGSLLNKGLEPHWFGLGFVQLKLNGTQRLHFWHPMHFAMTPEEELHDHRYDFTSCVMAGNIEHEVWQWNACQTGNHEMVEVSCQPGVDTKPKMLSTGNVEICGRYKMAQGSSYWFPANGFHKGRASDGAITLLTRSAVSKEFARVIRPLGQADVCPFSSPKSTEECWKIIESVIGITNV